jgi:hypothetical protein
MDASRMIFCLVSFGNRMIIKLMLKNFFGKPEANNKNGQRYQENDDTDKNFLSQCDKIPSCHKIILWVKPVCSLRDVFSL